MEREKVWDPFVRIFHWMLAVAVFFQLATAEDFNTLHVLAGLGIGGLLAARILWGFFGTEHARFRDFIYPPRDILAYLVGMVTGRSKRYVGHNPAGGAMVCALLFFLVLIVSTGWMTYANAGPGRLSLTAVSTVGLAWADGDHPEGRDDHGGGSHPHDRFWKEIHESLVGITLGLILLHVCGVLASSYLHRENLILAMITGSKKKT